nr:reverse transcriptase domain-containing protein [Tanacetum cinerariifolium]
MDDEPMWAADRLVALTLASIITIPKTANEYAIKDLQRLNSVKSLLFHKFRIQQYLQHEHYALWEVIEFGDSYEVPASAATTKTASDGTSKKSEWTVTVTTKDMQKRKNDVKARTTLLLSLPDEHQLRFIKGLELDVQFKTNKLECLAKELETLKKEKEGLDGKLTGFLTASKDLDNLIESLPDFADDMITDYSRPSPTIKSTSGDDQNRNPSVFETEASPSTITPKPFIKFVKPNVSPSKGKADKVETSKKPLVNSQNNIDDKGYWDSGCSRHMTGNISYLSDFELFDGGYMSFGQGGCKITGKGTIKTGKLEFDNVYFVKDLKYNLFSVSQICDNKNSVLFTDSECIVLGRDFKLLDDANILLRTPRQHNMYSIDLNNIVPHKDLTCLVAKASADECMLWHRRLGTNSTKLLGTKDAARQEVKNDVSFLRYIALPNWVHDALLESSSSKPQDDCSTDVSESSGNSNPTATSTKPPADQLDTLTVETPIPTVSSPVPTACFTDSPEPSSDARLISKRVANQVETPSLDNILTLATQFEDILEVTTNSDESNGVEADVSNMETTITASPTSKVRIHKDHPKSQIISPVDTPIQTRNKSKEVEEQSFITTIHQKTDLTLLQFCLFSCFLSQVEPKKISDALQDPSWVEAMHEELLQFKIQNVWTLVNCPKEEEGIDYDEVFAPVAKIEAIRLFLAYASFMGFTVYQMDVKSALLYGNIDEEVYVMQPTRFQDLEFPAKVYKVEKTISSSTPMDKENPWGKDRTGKDVDLHLYRSMIGSLMYLTASRPDIMFPVYACARHQVIPKNVTCMQLSGSLDLLTKPFDVGRFQYLVGEHNVDFHPIVDFVEASPLRYALTFKPTVYVSHIRQFWSTVRIEKKEEGTKILSTVDGILRTVTESSLRRNLKLQDEEGINSLHDAELFENLTLMGYNISPDQKTVTESSLRRNLKLQDEEGINSLHDAELFENLTLMGYNISPDQKFTFQKGTPTEPYHIPSPEAHPTSHTTPSSPTLPSITTVPIPTVTPSDTPTLSLQRQHSEMVVKFKAQEPEISRLKVRVKLLEDREGVAAERSGDDAPIKRVNLDEKEAAAERVSDDSEETVAVLTSRDTTTILASRVVVVPTGSGSIPTAGPPAAEVPTSSDVVPTAGLNFSTATVLEEEMERDAQMMNEQIARDAEIARIHAEGELRIELISDLVRYQDNYAKVHKYQSQQRKPWSKKKKRDYYMAVIKSNLGWKVKDFRGMTFEEIKSKFTIVWKQLKDFILMGSKEKAKMLKRKGLSIEQESVKKLKTSEEFAEEAKSPDEVPEEKVKEMMQLVPIEEVYVEALQVKHPIIDWKVHTKGHRAYWKIIRLGGNSASCQFFVDLLKHLDRKDLNQLWVLVKESLSNRPPTSDKEMELWVELKRKGLDIGMISYKLQVENYSRMANDLILKIYEIASTPRQQVIEFPLAEEVPTASEESFHCQKKRDATAKRIALLSKSHGITILGKTVIVELLYRTPCAIKGVLRLADKQSGRPFGSLPSNTQPNPKGSSSKPYQPPQAQNEHVNAVFTRSGKSYHPPDKPNDQQNNFKNPINFDSDEEKNEPTPQTKPKTRKPVKETPIPKSCKPKIPYPQRLRKEKIEAQYGKFLDMIRAVRINVPLVDVLARMPNYGKFLKELVNNKHKIEQISAAFLSDESSTILQTKFHRNFETLKVFSFHVISTKAFSCNALADLGASINIMPYSLYAKLYLENLKPTKISIRLADQSIQYPVGIVKNILIEVEEDFDALLDEGSKILHSIEGTILEAKLFVEFDEFVAMTVDENSEFESDTEEPQLKKITFNTDYNIKTSIEEPLTDLKLIPLPDTIEYVFLE